MHNSKQIQRQDKDVVILSKEVVERVAPKMKVVHNGAQEGWETNVLDTQRSISQLIGQPLFFLYMYYECVLVLGQFYRVYSMKGARKLAWLDAKQEDCKRPWSSVLILQCIDCLKENIDIFRQFIPNIFEF